MFACVWCLMGRWRYMAGGASYGLVYPSRWQYHMLFVYVWFQFGMRKLGAVTLICTNS